MKYKEFELIGSSFACDKNCPYCTAKITKWYETDDNLNELPNILNKLKNKNISFKYFIMSGNGEPSLNHYDKLKFIHDTVENSEMFDEFRIQTSGNLFFEDDKFQLFKDWLIEITRVSYDDTIDMNTLGYHRNYMKTTNFKNAKNIRLNYVMLKNKTFKNIKSEIKAFINHYTNICTVSLKTLNCGTGYGNPDSTIQVDWINKNAYTKKDTDLILKNFLTDNNNVIINTFFDRIEWKFNNIPITFYLKKNAYGSSNMVFYGGRLVDYSLKDILI